MSRPRRDGPDGDVAALDRVRLRVAAGADPGDGNGLPEPTARLLRVAVEVGAPLGPALDVATAAADDARRCARAVAVASAQAKAVATGLTIAPLVLVPVLSRLFGVDLVAYHRTGVGVVTGALAAVLLAIGIAVSRAAIARVGRPPRRTTATDPALADAIEVAAVAVGGGLTPAAALRTAAQQSPPGAAAALRQLALDLEHGRLPADLPPGVDRLADVLTTADAVGAPVGPSLRRLAADLRADEQARVLAAAERLPVQLTFPTALCLLPGVLLLIGAPIVHAGLGMVGT